MAKHTCNKEAEIAVINERQEYMAKQLNDIHKALMGNGKPGLIHEFNQWKGFVKGAAWLFSGAILLLTTAMTVVAYIN